MRKRDFNNFIKSRRTWPIKSPTSDYVEFLANMMILLSLSLSLCEALLYYVLCKSSTCKLHNMAFLDIGDYLTLTPLCAYMCKNADNTVSLYDFSSYSLFQCTNDCYMRKYAYLFYILYCNKIPLLHVSFLVYSQLYNILCAVCITFSGVHVRFTLSWSS